MTTVPARYVVDTCSFTAIRKNYPQDVFPSVWSKLDEIANAGTIASVENVLKELEVQDDEVLAWAKANQAVFLPLDDAIQKQAKVVLKSHAALLDLRRRRSGADPFVVAAALVHSCVVVTEEKESNSPLRPKIPNVCAAYSIQCIGILEVFRREGLKL
jgi:Domain of unknown function (DUF4411)